MFHQSTGCSRLGGKNESYNEKLQSALVGVAKWLERQPTHRRVMGWIPCQGHVPGFQVRSQLWEATVNVSLSLSPAFHSKKVDGKISLSED